MVIVLMQIICYVMKKKEFRSKKKKLFIFIMIIIGAWGQMCSYNYKFWLKRLFKKLFKSDVLQLIRLWIVLLFEWQGRSHVGCLTLEYTLLYVCVTYQTGPMQRGGGVWSSSTEQWIQQVFFWVCQILQVNERQMCGDSTTLIRPNQCHTMTTG